MVEDFLYDEGIEGVALSDGSPEGFNPSSVPDDNEITVTSEQIIDALKEVINENSETGDNLSSDQVLKNDSLQNSLNVQNEIIDYTDFLTDIYDELVELNTNLESFSSSYNSSILDKNLNEYNINQSLLCIIIVCFFVKGVLYFIKHFTPRLWR